MEMWKSVVGFENYLISSHGRVRSVKARKGSRALVNGGILTGWIQTIRPGYTRRLVALRKDGETHYKKIHHLVLEAFVGPRPERMEALHKDGKTMNNSVKNLRWGTHRDNVLDSIAHGTKTKPPVFQGESHHNVTIPTKVVRAMRLLPYQHGLFSKLARKHHVSLNTISRIYRGKSRGEEK